MTRIHLATGVAVRDRSILLVASVYPSHRDPIWSLPGGRQRHGELLSDALLREVHEETGLHAAIGDLAYVSESYDGDIHVINATFEISLRGEIHLPSDDHVVAAEWCPFDRIEQRMTLAVARTPLLNYLQSGRRYRGFAEAGVSVIWPDEA